MVTQCLAYAIGNVDRYLSTSVVNGIYESVCHPVRKSISNCASGPLQPDGCKLSVLLTFLYVKEKSVIFPAPPSMLLVGTSRRHIINNELVKEV